MTQTTNHGIQSVQPTKFTTVKSLDTGKNICIFAAKYKATTVWVSNIKYTVCIKKTQCYKNVHVDVKAFELSPVTREISKSPQPETFSYRKKKMAVIISINRELDLSDWIWHGIKVKDLSSLPVRQTEILWAKSASFHVNFRNANSTFQAQKGATKYLLISKIRNQQPQSKIKLKQTCQIILEETFQLTDLQKHNSLCVQVCVFMEKGSRARPEGETTSSVG